MRFGDEKTLCVKEGEEVRTLIADRNIPVTMRGPRPCTMSEWGFPAGVVLGSGLPALAMSNFRPS